MVSESISNLEDQIGVQLFDRSGRYPQLTPAGLAMLADARSIITGVDLLTRLIRQRAPERLASVV